MVGALDRCDKDFNRGRMGHRRGELEKPRASGLGPPRSTRNPWALAVGKELSDRGEIPTAKHTSIRPACVASRSIRSTPEPAESAGAKAGGLASVGQASQGKLDEPRASNPDPPTRVHTRSETTTTSHEKSRWRRVRADRSQEGPTDLRRSEGPHRAKQRNSRREGRQKNELATLCETRADDVRSVMCYSSHGSQHTSVVPRPETWTTTKIPS